MTQSPYREREAQTYDQTRRIERHWAREHDYVRVLLGHAAPGRMLDVPIGTGRFLPLCSRVRVVAGVDLSGPMLAEAQRRSVDLELTKLFLARGSITQLPFANHSFDLSLCCRLLHLLPEAQLEPAFAELARVTAGRICAQAYVRGPLWLRARGRLQRMTETQAPGSAWAHIHAYSHEEHTLRAAAERAGLRFLSGIELDHYYGSRVMMYEWKSRS
jgi:SAM-dependent methyltransferase